MTLGRTPLPSRVLDASGILLAADGNSIHKEDDSIWAMEGLNLQSFSRVMLGIDTLPWQYRVLSILATLIGNSFITLGLMIQKRSHKNDKEEHLKRWYFLSSTWLFGLFVCIVGHGFCWIGLALGAQTVLSCLSCWTMVLTCVFAPCILGETLSTWKVLTVAMLVIGCALVVMNGSQKSQMLTREKLLQDLQGTVFMGLCAASLFTTLFLGRQVGRQTSKVLVFKLCFYAAFGAWYAVLSSKTMSSLMFTSFYNHNNQFKCIEFWIIAVLFLGFAGWNFHFLNMALAEGEAVSVIPMYEAMSILGQVVLGGVFFGEFHDLGIERLLYFCFGVCCCVSGVMCINVQGPKVLEECMSSKSAEHNLGEIS